MATTFSATHMIEPASRPATKAAANAQGDGHRSQFGIFVSDLIEDLHERPLQPAHLAKHDMFREHINAMASCYFALILLLIAASVPVLAYFIPWGAL
jgi:hypothetical protein